MVDNGFMVSEYLTAEVALGRKAGPFNQLPFFTYVRSLMGVVIKKCSDYASFHQAISLITKQGVGTLMAKIGPSQCLQAHSGAS